METESAVTLKQLMGALVFGGEEPLTPREILRCLQAVAESDPDAGSAFADVKEKDIRAALADLDQELRRSVCGFQLREVAGGFRLQSDPSCGRWMKELLDAGKPQRLSRPSLETLAIIAYRQPVTRSEIEGVRGVSVDHVLKLLMELQLVRITGRSELPGRPFLYGTTHHFLEHFGLKGLDELSSMEPMLVRGAVPVGSAPPRPAAANEPDLPGLEKDGEAEDDDGEEG